MGFAGAAARGLLAAVALLAGACGAGAPAPAGDPGVPPAPDAPSAPARLQIRHEDLPPPHQTRSVANPPRIVDRPPGAALEVPGGFRVIEAASGLRGPRRMELSPAGEVFLAETGAGRILILPDPDGDGRFAMPVAYARGLDRPFGMAFAPGALFVGTEGAVLRFRYTPGDRKAAGPPVTALELPTGGHWTRDVLYEPDTERIYVSVGSRSNSDEEPLPRASVFWIDRRAPKPAPSTYASGLRNPVALDREPVTGAIWTVVNEMDGLGDELPPDWATALTPGGFYGWPHAYAGNHPVPGIAADARARVEKALRPDVLLRAHSAPLGIRFYTGRQFPARFRGGAFIALHGSWNARERRGYEVVFLPFRDGKALGWSEPFLRGFALDAGKREVWGRPVGLLVDRDGSLLVSEDAGGTVWRVRYEKGGA